MNQYIPDMRQLEVWGYHKYGKGKRSAKPTLSETAKQFGITKQGVAYIVRQVDRFYRETTGMKVGAGK